MIEKARHKIQQLNIHKASFLVIMLPYLGANIISLSASPFFSVFNLILLLVAIVAIEVITSYLIEGISQRYNSIKLEKALSITLVTITIEFFYGFTLNIPLHKITQTIFSIELREKILLIIALILLVGLQIIFLRKRLSYKGMNIFFIILTVMTLGSSVSKRPTKLEPLNSIQNNYHKIGRNDQGVAIKPVILIIVDEYNSPDNLFQITKDSSVYSFNQWLNKNGWQTKTSAYSYELSTIHSMSSMFNFNLSKDLANSSKTSNYSKQSEEKIVLSKLFQAALADSLTNKGVRIYNYGIFDLGKTKPISRLYLYPRNFIETFLMHSTFFGEKIKTGNFQVKYLKNPPNYIFDHNENLLNNLSENLNKALINNKSFVYVHLYLPHYPFNVHPTFIDSESKNFNKYLNAWYLTNHKIQALLFCLTKNNQYRIILTGDHGFRRSITNAHLSFSAYYGFEGFELDKIKSVQDNGSLINAAF